jgi:type IV pilus assembly protein PilY1
MAVLTLYPQATADTCIWADDGTGFTTAAPGYLGGTGAAGVFYRSAIRFPIVHIPHGATINSAILTLYSHVALDTMTINLIVYGNDTADAAAPASAGAGSAKVLTTAGVAWVLTAWLLDTGYSSNDLSAVIQEITDRSDWVSGNDIMLVIKDNGTTDTASVREYYNYVHATAAYYPKLVINYAAPALGTITSSSGAAEDDGYTGP